MADIIGAKELAFNPADIATDYKRNLTDNMTRQTTAMDLATKTQEFKDQQAQRQAMQQNYNPQTGELSLPGMRGSAFAQQNPDMAMAVEKHIRENGLEKTAQTARETSDYFAQMKGLNPDSANYLESYNKIRQHAVDHGHPEFANLSDIPSQQQINNGLINNQGASQQVSNMIATRQKALEIIGKAEENGAGVHPAILEMAGLPSGGAPPANAHQAEAIKKLPPSAQSNYSSLTDPIQYGKKMDREGVKNFQASLSARTQNNPAFSQAQSDLYAVNKAMAIFDSHKDLNKVNTQEQHILAGEVAKAIKGGASPTEDEVKSFMPGNLNSMSADTWAKISSKPLPTNNAEYYQGLKEYLGHISEKAQNVMGSAYEDALNENKNSVHPKTWAELRASKAQYIKNIAGGSNQMSKPAPQQQDPWIIQYAKDHKITPEQAARVRDSRMEKGK